MQNPQPQHLRILHLIHIRQPRFQLRLPSIKRQQRWNPRYSIPSRQRSYGGAVEFYFSVGNATLVFADVLFFDYITDYRGDDFAGGAPGGGPEGYEG